MIESAAGRSTIRAAACMESEDLETLDRALARESVRSSLFGPGAPPIRLGRFELERRIGAGAMGIVFVAYDPRLRRRVAIKLLQRASDPARAERRMLREAQALARFTHPNVVHVYEVG